jgi:hypothetical protein
MLGGYLRISKDYPSHDILPSTSVHRLSDVVFYMDQYMYLFRYDNII